MRNLLIILLIGIIYSCDNKYTYIEIVKEKDIIGSNYSKKEKDPITINAPSDSMAYLLAYKKFCISIKANQYVSDKIGTRYSIPYEFKLFNSKGIDISSIDFVTKNDKEIEILSQITSLRSTVPNYEKEENIINKVNIDSSKIKDLIKYFDIKHDDFSTNNKTWYTPKSAPKYTNDNGIYCYFLTIDNKPAVLRFVIQYYSDEWLFFSKVQFSIGDKAFEYIPTSTKTDSGNGGYIWEWFDEAITASDIDLLNALSNTDKAKMKFIGDKYYDIKTISPKQCLDIRRTLDLYKAMGGAI